jgi:hypothetical protein
MDRSKIIAQFRSMVKEHLKMLLIADSRNDDKDFMDTLELSKIEIEELIYDIKTPA